MNINNYVRLNQKTFLEDELKDTDFAVFAQLSYANFSKYLKKEENVKLSSFVSEDDYNYISSTALANKQTHTLIKSMSKSNRFKDVEVFNYNVKNNQKLKIQFGGMIFKLPNNSYVIAFRGTDTSLNGWYESLMLSYKENVTNGQLYSLNYLKESLNLIPSDADIYLAGHSKGGNNIQYAFLSLTSQEKDRIKQLYNFEGPGNRFDFFNDENFKSVESKIHKYVTSDSIIGLLLYDFQKHNIIEASGTNGIIQHTIFTWKLDENTFKLKQINSISKNALAFSISVDKWLANSTPSQTQKLIDDLFQFLSKAGIKNQRDLSITNLDKLVNLFKQYSSINKKEKRNITNQLSNLFKIFLSYRFMSFAKLLEISKYEKFLVNKVD